VRGSNYDAQTYLSAMILKIATLGKCDAICLASAY